MSVISGHIENLSVLNRIADFTIDYSSYQELDSNHMWISSIENRDVLKDIDEVRCSSELYSKIEQNFPEYNIQNVPEVDELYYAVSPDKAKGSDRVLVDCHYDSPYASFPTDVIFYRVIVACNENTEVQTSFPNNNITVTMNIGDFHGLDYNKDYHCVNGSIPKNKKRVLMKLHYILVPRNKKNTFSVNFFKFLNIQWTYISRFCMRNSVHSFHPLGLLVKFSRWSYNNNFFIIFVHYFCYLHCLSIFINHFLQQPKTSYDRISN